ncbi:toll/interleukin-1 receptor domain-containing protein [Clavibacter michiganensis]|uniref:toll/interleukin-1 receptor domain-containing protein n=1 Tax=Clavibacter michiganensis TaxID=28447 RepID=UPI003EB71669
MKLFISWSGAEAREVAKALRSFLPRVLTDKLIPFVSSDDIEKGSRGLPAIASELEEAAFGIVIVTPANMNSAWINFEAGALAKSIKYGKVAPLLVGLSTVDLTGPLSQFQNVIASDREAVLSLVTTINGNMQDNLPPHIVETMFDKEWPSLEVAIRKASELDETSAPVRDPESVLDEILLAVRGLARGAGGAVAGAAGYERDPLRTHYINEPWSASDGSVAPLYEGGATPNLPVSNRTLIFDIARDLQVGFLEGRLPLPPGSHIELLDSHAGLTTTVVVKKVRIGASFRGAPGHLILDCEVDEQWALRIYEGQKRE